MLPDKGKKDIQLLLFKKKLKNNYYYEVIIK